MESSARTEGISVIVLHLRTRRFWLPSSTQQVQSGSPGTHSHGPTHLPPQHVQPLPPHRSPLIQPPSAAHTWVKSPSHRSDPGAQEVGLAAGRGSTGHCTLVG